MSEELSGSVFLFCNEKMNSISGFLVDTTSDESDTADILTIFLERKNIKKLRLSDLQKTLIKVDETNKVYLRYSPPGLGTLRYVKEGG